MQCLINCTISKMYSFFKKDKQIIKIHARVFHFFKLKVLIKKFTQIIKQLNQIKTILKNNPNIIYILKTRTKNE